MAAHAAIIDYYAILNLPPNADLAGIENAYAHLSEELVRASEDDDTNTRALARLNEAYGVLSHPPLRRDYDRVYFSSDILREQARRLADERTRGRMRYVLIGALLLIVAAQGLALAYIGRGEIADSASTIFGPLMPGDAN